jgi:chromate transport protein ChrA
LGIISSIILLVILRGLVKHFFDTGWLKALIIAVVAAIIWIVIVAILAVLLGLAIIGFGLL